jgi:hypothetical protein
MFVIQALARKLISLRCDCPFVVVAAADDAVLFHQFQYQAVAAAAAERGAEEVTRLILVEDGAPVEFGAPLMIIE